MLEGQILDATVPLADGVTIAGEKALYRLLTWRDGRFEFVPGQPGEQDRMGKPSRALLLEGRTRRAAACVLDMPATGGHRRDRDGSRDRLLAGPRRFRAMPRENPQRDAWPIPIST